jgi:predicted Rossmann fold flavoprotein
VKPADDEPRKRDLPIVVIGAGAAGLMAAIAAASYDGDAPARPSANADGRAPGPHASPAPPAVAPRVLVLERTHDGGRKILISGGGRCNVLPSVLQPERFVTNSSPHTLRNLLRSWPLADQRAFFESTLAIPLALEADSGKLFPASNSARHIRDGLIRHAQQRGVAIRFDTRVVDLVPPRDAASWRIEIEHGEAIEAAAVILATGGLSVPATGSDGGGLALARRLGHAMHETYPALTPLVADPAMHEALAGVSLQARLRAAATDGARPLITDGGFLFTHRGYSGPAVLDISHVAVRARLAQRPQAIQVQWAPGQDDAQWQALLRPTPGDGHSLVVSRVRQHLPNRLADWLVSEAGIPLDRSLATLTRAERLGLIERLCRYPLPWTGDEGYKKAEVTGGGVALDEVDPRTLESRRRPGLFLCGELLDAFGPIGGHNFAWAWATGRLAGLGARARVTRQ